MKKAHLHRRRWLRWQAGEKVSFVMEKMNLEVNTSQQLLHDLQWQGDTAFAAFTQDTWVCSTVNILWKSLHKGQSQMGTTIINLANNVSPSLVFWHARQWKIVGTVQEV